MRAAFRVGTWNLAGRWSDDHERLMLDLDCDVLLLTEVSERVHLPGYELHLGTATMAPRRRWAAVASRRNLIPLPDPHFASAAGEVDGLRFVGSILPWRSCGTRWPGSTTAQRTELALAEIERAKPEIWGGDFNHALTGREHSGSMAGRRMIQSLATELGLAIPTTELPHRIDGLLSIDHLAVPASWDATATRIPAEREGRRLSDHDAYVLVGSPGRPNRAG